jgi:4-hydroxy-3-methylbut-2-enyl diphosphate reductase
MAESGFTVLVFGDPEHREVKGVLGWAGSRGVAIQDGESLPGDLPSRVAVISQTTQSPERFAAFVSRLMQERLSEISELRLINTLCDVTSSQQHAARELANEVDVMIVIGGKASANTRHLLEVCQEEGVAAHHIEGEADLEPQWFSGIEKVGVTAGASTPDSAVETVVRRIQLIAADDGAMTA